MVKHR